MNVGKVGFIEADCRRNFYPRDGKTQITCYNEDTKHLFPAFSDFCPFPNARRGGGQAGTTGLRF